MTSIDQRDIDDVETIKKFLSKMSIQDNKATASPYYYVIFSSAYHYEKADIWDKGGDNICYSCREAEYYETYDDYDELVKDIKESYPEDYEKFIGEIEFFKKHHYYTEHGMFLTEDDAKNHLRRNAYHYSKDAHTYVKHAWRAPELEGFITALFNYFRIPKGNTYLNGVNHDNADSV